MRYLPHTEEQINQMLSVIGKSKIEDLFDTIPSELRLKNDLDITKAKSEIELRDFFTDLAKENQSSSQAISFLGGGAYHHYVPSIISQLILRGEFLTTYTPYQPEVSQGTLQALFEYQTMMCELTGMDVANGSNYDLSTACAEALLMSERINKKKKALISKSLNPQYKRLLHTYLDPFDFELVEINHQLDGSIDLEDLHTKLDDTVGSVLIQSPNYFGVIEDIKKIGNDLEDHPALFITANSEALSSVILETPKNAKADIALMEAQSFGVGLNFGGPYLGVFATLDKYIRQMPGRVVGETIDQDGNEGYVLTFATREQHIRREKATSNICTNQGLCTLMATIYLSLLGKVGLKELAKINLSRAEYTKEKLTKLNGVELVFKGVSFNEFVIKIPQAKEVLEKLAKENIFLGISLEDDFKELKDGILVCVTEMNSKENIDELVNKLSQVI
jgi:glycine dehydrogenase subunit 1